MRCLCGTLVGSKVFHHAVFRQRLDDSVVLHGDLDQITDAGRVPGHRLLGVLCPRRAVARRARHIPQVRHTLWHAITGNHHVRVVDPLGIRL